MAEDSSQLGLWYDCRDYLCAKCEKEIVKLKVEKTVQMALQCQQVADARWLLSVLSSCFVEEGTLLSDLFLGDDARSLCFAAVTSVFVDLDLLRRSVRRAEAYPFAMAQLAKNLTDGEEKLFWASCAARQAERDGYYELGVCLQFGIGCDLDLQTAKRNFLLAAK